jgi:hypothetical protein
MFEISPFAVLKVCIIHQFLSNPEYIESSGLCTSQPRNIFLMRFLVFVAVGADKKRVAKKKHFFGVFANKDRIIMLLIR